MPEIWLCLRFLVCGYQILIALASSMLRAVLLWILQILASIYGSLQVCDTFRAASFTRVWWAALISSCIAHQWIKQKQVRIAFQGLRCDARSLWSFTSKSAPELPVLFQLSILDTVSRFVRQWEYRRAFEFKMARAFVRVVFLACYSAQEVAGFCRMH